MLLYYVDFATHYWVTTTEQQLCLPTWNAFALGLAHPTQKGLKPWGVVWRPLWVLQLRPCTFYQTSPESSLAHTHTVSKGGALGLGLNKGNIPYGNIIRSPKVGGSGVGKFPGSVPASVLPPPATWPWPLWRSSWGTKMATAAHTE